MTWPKAKLGMAMLILTESVFFFMLILAYVYFRDDSLIGALSNLNLPLTTIYTGFLVASSFTIWRGEKMFTILMGSVFLLGQGSDFYRMVYNGLSFNKSLFGTTYFTLAGIHGLHVLLGLVLVAVNRSAREAVAMYWHFVVASWIGIYCVVYLWTLL
jgi:cytochrome c oxidase subunit 3